MSEITVSPNELAAASATIQRIGDQVRQSATMQSPDVMMMGAFMAPFLAATLPAMSSGLSAIVDGCGVGFAELGDRLRDTAKAYAELEQWATELARSTVAQEL